MSESHPYCVEYAKSGRSKCRGCSANIEFGLVRLGININTQVTHWFHTDCFFKRHKPGNTNDIANFKKLRADDQAIVRAFVGVVPEEIQQDEEEPAESEKSTKSKKTKASEKAEKTKPKAKRAKVVGNKSDFMVDYSLSSRAKCCSCHTPIEKSVVRIARMDYTSNIGSALKGIPRWYHKNCFVSNRDFFEFWDSAEALPGFFTLKAADQEELLEALPEFTLDKATEEGAGGWKKFKIANFKLGKLKNYIKTLTNKELEAILTHNKQTVAKQTKKEHLVQTVFVLARYGVVGKCPKCNEQTLENLPGNVFKCTSQGQDNAPCEYKTEKPPLVAMKVPKKLRDEHEFLKNYDFTVQDGTITQAEMNIPTTVPLNVDAREFVPSAPKEKQPKGRLHGMEFALFGVPEAKEMVTNLGGRVVVFINQKTAAIISDEETIQETKEAKNKRLRFAEDHMTPIVGIDFLHKVRHGGRNVKKLIKECDMTVDWLYDGGYDPFSEKYGPWGRNYW